MSKSIKLLFVVAAFAFAISSFTGEVEATHNAIADTYEAMDQAISES